jgi:hypothetical protein
MSVDKEADREAVTFNRPRDTQPIWINLNQSNQCLLRGVQCPKIKLGRFKTSNLCNKDQKSCKDV